MVCYDKNSYEKNVATKKEEKSAHSWVFKKNQEPRRAKNPHKETAERKKKTCGVVVVDIMALLVRKAVGSGNHIISISKNVIKKAVVRNTVRRRIRAILRALPLSNSHLRLMIIVRSDVSNESFKSLTEEVYASVRRLFPSL